MNDVPALIPCDPTTCVLSGMSASHTCFVPNPAHPSYVASDPAFNGKATVVDPPGGARVAWASVQPGVATDEEMDSVFNWAADHYDIPEWRRPT